MGCNGGCGGKGRSSNGVTPAHPIIFGEDSSELPTRRVIIVKGIPGVKPRSPRYVRGSDVDTLIVNGQLKLLEN